MQEVRGARTIACSDLPHSNSYRPLATSSTLPHVHSWKSKLLPCSLCSGGAEIPLEPHTQLKQAPSLQRPECIMEG